MCYHPAVQRRHHYEQAFEEYLRARRIPYVAVDEARKALLPDEARIEVAVGSPDGPKRAIKSFDFVLYAQTGNLLIECKGRKITPRLRKDAQGHARSSGAGRLECWVTEEDVASLSAWERLFGDGFQAAFVFIYWCDEQPALPLFEEIFEFKGRWYAIRAVTVRDYARAMRPRSPRWRTVHMPGAEFDRLSRPLSSAVSDPLHRAPVEVASPLR
jgi:hypothetical protein